MMLGRVLFVSLIFSFEATRNAKQGLIDKEKLIPNRNSDLAKTNFAEVTNFDSGSLSVSDRNTTVFHCPKLITLIY